MQTDMPSSPDLPMRTALLVGNLIPLTVAAQITTDRHTERHGRLRARA